MTDLIERLRVIADKTTIGPQTILKAADEIVRLRARIEVLEAALDRAATPDPRRFGIGWPPQKPQEVRHDRS